MTTVKPFNARLFDVPAATGFKKGDMVRLKNVPPHRKPWLADGDVGDVLEVAVRVDADANEFVFLVQVKLWRVGAIYNFSPQDLEIINDDA